MVTGQSLNTLHEVLSASLAAHLPPVVAGYLAIPVIDGGYLQWHSDLATLAIAADQLPERDRGRFTSLLNERMQAFNGLAARLEGQGETQLATQLRQIATAPDLTDLYAVGGLPVRVNWHRQLMAKTEQRPPMVRAAAPLPPPAAIGAIAAAPAPSATMIQPSMVGRPWWKPVAAGAAFLLLLLLIALLMRECSFPQYLQSTPNAPAPVPSAGLIAPQPAPAAAENLDAEIQRLEAQLRERLHACKAPALLPASPLPQSLPPAPKTTELEIEPPAAAESPPKVKQPVEKPPPPLPKTQTAKADPPPACPAERQSWEAPELVIVMDTSNSMALPTNVSPTETVRLLRAAEQGDAQALMQLEKWLRAPHANSRLAQVQTAIAGTIPQLPKDISTGLVMFGDCNAVQNLRFYSGSERPQLIQSLRAARPKAGTPLTRALERAGTMINGRDVPSIIVLISDGMDSCGGDPCAVARALKAQKPQLKINYIDVGGETIARCTATETGGRVLTLKDGMGLEDLLREAYEQPDTPPHCVKP